MKPDPHTEEEGEMASRRTVELSWEQRQELAAQRDHDPRPYVRERCAAVLKIAEGQAAYWVARRGLLQVRDPDTGYSWLAHYQADGLAGLLAYPHGGNRRRLPPTGCWPPRTPPRWPVAPARPIASNASSPRRAR